MKNRWVRKLAAGMAALVTASALLAGCGGTTTADNTPADSAPDETADVTEDVSGAKSTEEDPYAGKSTDYTMVPGGSVDAGLPFSDWESAPAVAYWVSRQYNGKDVSISFETPPNSADSDYYSTLLATGEYTDLMTSQLLPAELPELYGDGIILDLTDYVDEYMPNYKAWIEEHPEYQNQMYFEVDGEPKLLSIWAVSDQPGNPWESYMYRRDWIVKYGKDADGNAFTGGWNEDKTEWTDDIVFPSGNTDPVYISDWEWMFDIFQEALAATGNTDGYAFQQHHVGYMNFGNLVTSFGGIAPAWYETRDGEIHYGFTDDEVQMRAYVECMKNWYDKGYMDPNFDERAGDSIFFMIDQANTYSGNVGMWLGLTSQLGNAMDTGSETTDGICYFACANPINDVYGDTSAQGEEPWVFFESGNLLGGSVVVTDKAKDKDLKTLFTMFDWLYSEEGAELTSFGLTKEQAEAAGLQDTMESLGLPNGSYTVETTDDGEKLYVLDENVINSLEVGVTVSLNRMQCGLTINKNVDKHEGDFLMEQYARIMKYQGSAGIGYLENKLSAEQSQANSLVGTNVGTYLSQAVPDFITGRTEFNDANWADFVETVRSYGVDDVTESLRALQ